MKNLIRIAKKENSIVFAVASLYHLLISLIIILFSGKEYNAQIIVCVHEDRKNDINVFNKMKQKIESYGINCRIIVTPQSSYGKIIFYLKGMASNYCGIESDDFKVGNNDYLLFNFLWIFDSVISTVMPFYKLCRNSIFIEDGATSFVNPNVRSGETYLRLKRILGISTDFYNDDKLLGIYVQCPEYYPDYMMDKINKMNIYDIPEEHSDLMVKIDDVFLSSKDIIEIDEMRKSDGIIFTQPLSEDGIISESEKVRIFKEMLVFYSRFGRVILKRHPRDTTDYDLDNFIIAEGIYPSELLTIKRVRFHFAIGLCTSAIETVDADIRVNINPNFTRDLKVVLREI